MQKVLFIDRDGTLVAEPPIDYQLDSLEKLEFYPYVFQYLGRIAQELNYKLVMVTNQDGLGTDSFPEKDFLPAHQKIIHAFKNEGVVFSEIHIDNSFPHENKPTRKPGTAMLQHFIKGDYDLANSFVIGDRMTDVLLAKNLGCQAIFMGQETTENQIALQTKNWEEIYRFLKKIPRKATISRKTNETNIVATVNLDGIGKSEIKTGIGFFDHMLEQIAKHAQIDMTLTVKGDLHVDQHHTIEDTALVLGDAFRIALDNKKGIERYGFVLPMDDCLAEVAIDFGGRAWLVWNVDFNREKIGDIPTEMFFHFFKSFTDNAKCNLNIKAEGSNEHHKIESIFKAFAKALQSAITKNNHHIIPSTKGTF